MTPRRICFAISFFLLSASVYAGFLEDNTDSFSPFLGKWIGDSLGMEAEISIDPIDSEMLRYKYNDQSCTVTALCMPTGRKEYQLECFGESICIQKIYFFQSRISRTDLENRIKEEWSVRRGVAHDKFEATTIWDREK
jgi:hypothetical protein